MSTSVLTFGASLDGGIRNAAKTVLVAIISQMRRRGRGGGHEKDGRMSVDRC
jgi:hypothetical protein